MRNLKNFATFHFIQLAYLENAVIFIAYLEKLLDFVRDEVNLPYLKSLSHGYEDYCPALLSE
jgi:hypothetical protein